jgi:protein-S-isoprenylcysteine O-methyltransferase Ste14
MGVALGVLSLVVYAWSRITLGKEWSSPLQIREKHHLVTTGPYARIRHPIYLALMGFLTGSALITANWFVIALLVFSIVDLNLRIPKEEQMMIEEFGYEYIAYMQKTGRLLPKIIQSKN